MEAPLVSIIIPTYKGSRTVELSVKSALLQNYQEIEIIVVDDNGKKAEEQIKTYEKLKNYITDKTIKYIVHETNRNGSAARNTGLHESKGKYVSFLDDDDYLLPLKTMLQVDALEKNEKATLCVCSGCYVNTNGIGYKKVIKYESNFLYKYLMDKIYFNTSAMMLRRDAVEAINGFDESFIRHQDWEFVVRILSQDNDVCVIPKVGIIRYLEGRNNAKNYGERIRNLEHFLDICEPFFKKKLSYKQISEVKKYRRRQITQEMIREGRLSDALSYGASYGSKFECIVSGIMIIPLMVRKLLLGSRNVALPRDKLSKTMD